MHATPFRKLPCAPLGSGVGWILHLVPPHRSASVVATPEASVKFPTAVQAEDDRQDTAPRKPVPQGFGVGWMCQVLPFHRSANVPTELPESSKDAPTAVHTEGAGHVTPKRPLDAAPRGSGVDWRLHFAPFQRSDNVPGPENPTAVQAEGVRQATPARPLCAAPRGLGMRWIAQSAPFHRSTKPTCLPAGSRVSPTETHADDAGQSTPNRKLFAPPGALGVG